MKEKVQAIVNFIKEIITDSSQDFQLCKGENLFLFFKVGQFLINCFVVVVTPPKRVLDLSKSLFNEKLYPAAKIHVQWEGKQPNPLLRTDIDVEIVDTQAPEANTPKIVEVKQAVPKKTTSSADNKKSQSTSTGAPKWFLSGKK